ncbi:UvrD-helicase domain-containing protein [Clostridium massiliodielmoense]|uniref:UvrD-helicase domain-containing protein n=1 Tax=Clostridium massiliodielmoense TaxID=1776385 RepID=UPI000A26E7F4|nr:UvrD-helicase domain-containing protein [Clostridium massiliodielmoense]
MYYLKCWTNCINNLYKLCKETLMEIDMLNEKYSELNIKILDVRNNIKYLDLEEKQYELDTLQYLRKKHDKLESKINEKKSFNKNPYFCKIKLSNYDKIFYISKDFSNIDKCIYNFTSPIAKLRFRKINESVYINNIIYKIEEIEFYTISDSKLNLLEHKDSKQYFKYDGTKVTNLDPEETNIINLDKLTHCHNTNLSKSNKYSPITTSTINSLLKNLFSQFQPRYNSELKDSKPNNSLTSIVELMQEEQDTVMRSPYEGITLICGSAGSGKTNIALHRIRYLINEFPNEFNKYNIGIFCFNVSLKNYLMNLITELNLYESNVFSYDEWIRKILISSTNIKSIDYCKEDDSIKYFKTNKIMVNIINEFLEVNKNNPYSSINNITYNKKNKYFNINGIKILNELYQFDKFNKYCDKHTIHISYVDNPISSSESYILGYILSRICKNVFLKNFDLFDHIVIDEAQDFSPIQIQLLFNITKNSMTMAGDITQKIFNIGLSSWQDIGLPLNNIYTLKVTHRASFETILFANSILNNSNDNCKAISVGKHGPKPVVVKSNNYNEALCKTLQQIKDIQFKNPNSSIAIVCPANKYIKDTNNFLLTNNIHSYIALKNKWDFNLNIAVSTYYQIKGLEFDYIIILGLNSYENMYLKNKENVLYTIITRAKEQVFINYEHKIPNLIKNIDKNLYTHY